MCGIAGIHRRTDKPVARLGNLTDELLWGIFPRGTHATGVLAMQDNGRVQLQKEPVPASDFIRRRKLLSSDSRTVLLHTRYATVGAKSDPRNAHPVINGTCAAVHNGTIWNHDELFKAFALKRHGAVDSEIIPALISHAGWEKAGQAFSLMAGGAATAIVTNERPGEVILARTENYPLHIWVGDLAVIWASTRGAIEGAYFDTYGRRPKASGFKVLPEWTMLRIGETITEHSIKPNKARRASAFQAPAPKKRPERAQEPISGPKGAKARSKSAARRRRRTARQESQMSLGDALRPTGGIDRSPWVLPHEEPEPWMEETVRDLERRGFSHDDAYEAVYGVAPITEPEWDYFLQP